MRWWKKVRIALGVLADIRSYSADILEWERQMRVAVETEQPLKVTPRECQTLLHQGRRLIEAARWVQGHMP